MKKLNEVSSRKIFNSERRGLPKLIFTFFIAAVISIIGQLDADLYAGQNDLRIHFIDVGYGDAIFIEFPDYSNMLLDAGEKYFAPVLLAYLESLKARAVGTAVITHPHQNHFEGFFSVLGVIPVHRVFINGDENAEKGYRELLEAFRQRSVPIKVLRRGEKIDRMPADVRMEVLHPRDLSGSPNDNSIVLRLTHRNVSFLFMGDVGPSVQRELIELYGEIKETEYIKVPHHGGPLSDRFVRAFAGKTFIISTGLSTWKHSRERDIQALEGEIYRTDLHGAVILESDGESVTVETFGYKED